MPSLKKILEHGLTFYKKKNKLSIAGLTHTSLPTNNLKDALRHSKNL